MVGGDPTSSTALERSELVGRYLRATLDATATLQRAEHPDEAMTALLHALCEQLDWDVAVIWKLDDAGALEAVDVWHAPDTPAAAVDAMTRRLRLGWGEGLPGKVLSTRGPRVVADVTASERYLRVAASREAGLVTGVGFPLVADEDVLGVIEFFSRRSREIDDELRATLAAIGRQLGAYLARVSSQAALEELAGTLQQALLPPTLPSVPGLELAALYRPGTEHVSVGGDIYDVFRIGRDEWGLLIADVCGKGAAAAAVTALARHTVRATAIENPSPAHVVAALNRALLDGGDRPFLTAVFATLRRRGADRARIAEWGWTAEIVCAGHPQPVLVTSEDTRVVGRPGTLVGVIQRIVTRPVTIDLVPGSTLVLYTDGITEARSGTGAFYGEARLLAALAAAGGGSARTAVDALVADNRRFARGPAAPADRRTDDDVAVLAVAVPPRPPGDAD